MGLDRSQHQQGASLQDPGIESHLRASGGDPEGGLPIGAGASPGGLREHPSEEGVLLPAGNLPVGAGGHEDSASPFEDGSHRRECPRRHGGSGHIVDHHSDLAP